MSCNKNELTNECRNDRIAVWSNSEWSNNEWSNSEWSNNVWSNSEWSPCVWSAVNLYASGEKPPVQGSRHLLREEKDVSHDI